DISRALAHDGEPLSPAVIAVILKEEGFAKLPRRRNEERPDQAQPVTADVADVRQLDLAPRALHTKFGGLFLFLPDLIRADLDRILVLCQNSIDEYGESVNPSGASHDPGATEGDPPWPGNESTR